MPFGCYNTSETRISGQQERHYHKLSLISGLIDQPIATAVLSPSLTGELTLYIRCITFTLILRNLNTVQTFWRLGL